jgi:hypothetical protein
VERFAKGGPEAGATSDWFAAAGCRFGPGRLTGDAGGLAWDLTYRDGAPTLYTFPRAVWEREILPGAQVVPFPSASFSGSVQLGGREVTLDRARGGLAHIYGHGHAERWGWLHADLGGGDVLEVVTAVSRRPGLRLLPPVSFVQLRVDGQDWPAAPLAAAPLLRGRLGLPEWSVSGIVGRRRLRVEVTVPLEASVGLDYRDPDGSPAVCTNSERASADIVVERWSGRWRREHRWRLEERAHAEVGLRGSGAGAVAVVRA